MVLYEFRTIVLVIESILFFRVSFIPVPFNHVSYGLVHILGFQSDIRIFMLAYLEYHVSICLQQWLGDVQSHIKSPSCTRRAFYHQELVAGAGFEPATFGL